MCFFYGGHPKSKLKCNIKMDLKLKKNCFKKKQSKINFRYNLIKKNGKSSRYYSTKNTNNVWKRISILTKNQNGY